MKSCVEHVVDGRLLQSMTEKETEELYDPKEEAAAEYLSEVSYGDAYKEYAHSGGILFSMGMSGEGFYGEELAGRINTAAKGPQFGHLRFDILSDDDFEAIRRAVMLPVDLHYNEFEYVVAGGDYDGGKFRRDEQWTSCDLTEIRDKVVKALAFFCLQGATLAKKLSVDIAKFSFIRAYALLMAGCINPDVPEAGLPKKAADLVVSWVSRGIRFLWGEIQIENNLKDWKTLEDNIAALTADPPKESFADDGGAQSEESANSPIVITCGTYGQKVVKSVDNETRTIGFVAKYGKKAKTYKVPPKSDKVWCFLKLLIETNAENGETEMPEEFKYWHGLFRRAKKLEDGSSVPVKTDLDELKKHIVSCKGAGKRGLPILKIVAEIPRKNARKRVEGMS